MLSKEIQYGCLAGFLHRNRPGRPLMNEIHIFHQKATFAYTHVARMSLHDLIATKKRWFQSTDV